MKFEQYHSIEMHRKKETEDSNRILVLTGLSGSGKDFLIDELKKSGNVPENITTVSFGEKLFQEIKKQFPEIENRDQLRRISNYDLVWGVNNVIETIIREQPVLLNTHVVYKQDGSLTTNPSVDKKINAGGYVFVWTDPEQIRIWREKDQTRKRERGTIEDISLDQSIALVVTAKIASHNGSAFHTIENRADNARHNIDLLSAYLQEAGVK